MCAISKLRKVRHPDMTVIDQQLPRNPSKLISEDGWVQLRKRKPFDLRRLRSSYFFREDKQQTPTKWASTENMEAADCTIQSRNVTCVSGGNAMFIVLGQTWKGGDNDFVIQSRRASKVSQGPPSPSIRLAFPNSTKHNGGSNELSRLPMYRIFPGIQCLELSNRKRVWSLIETSWIIRTSGAVNWSHKRTRNNLESDS